MSDAFAIILPSSKAQIDFREVKSSKVLSETTIRYTEKVTCCGYTVLRKYVFCVWA